MALPTYAQEVKFLTMLLEEMTEVHKLSVIYKDNQRTISLANNSQVGFCTKHIDNCHSFLRDMVEYKDIGTSIFVVKITQ